MVVSAKLDFLSSPRRSLRRGIIYLRLVSECVGRFDGKVGQRQARVSSNTPAEAAAAATDGSPRDLGRVSGGRVER